MSALEKFDYLYKSVEGIQKLSNEFHISVGIMVFVVAFFLFLSLFKSKHKFSQLAIPVVVSLMSSFLVAYGFLEHGIDKFWMTVETIFSFPELYVHTIMALVVITGSLFEILYLTKRVRLGLSAFALPLAFIINGVLFILHPHAGVHDEKVMFIHSVFGLLQIAAGVMLIIKRLIKKEFYQSVLTFLAAGCLLIFAFLLVQFREPASAFQSYFPASSNNSTRLRFENQGIIYIANSGVVPQNMQIKKGGTITFYQLDSSWHDMASGPHPQHTQYPPLNIGFLKPGESQTVTFTKIGNFGFHDHFHETDPRFQGEIEVQE